MNGLNERTTYAYDGEGRESLRQTANGVRVSTSYDNNGGVSLKQYWNSANAALAIYSGSYTRREQLSLQAELGTYPASYTYYANYQLGHDYRGGEQVNNYYDGVGNLSSRDNAGTTNYTYNSLNQMLTAVIGTTRTTLAYDLEGNMTSEIVGSSYTTFSYDAMNRLTTVNKDGTSESYVYSADGLRQQKTAGGSTVGYVWDGQNVLVETNTSLVVQAAYVDYPGMWGGLVSQNRSGTSNWYGFDIEGNTRILVSIGGVVTDSYSYRAFGEETAARGTTVNAYRFGGVVGYYRDSATREYLRQRHYRSDLSRFMSQDPIGFRGGDVNLYRYVGNNPTNFGDPSGLWDWRRWYMNGMGGLSGFVDTYLMNGSTANFGRVSEEYDRGDASGWDVVRAWGGWGFELASTADMLRGGGNLLWKAPRAIGKLWDVARLLPSAIKKIPKVKPIISYAWKDKWSKEAFGVCEHETGNIYLNFERMLQEARKNGVPIGKVVDETLRHEKVHRFFSLTGQTQNNAWRHELNDLLKDAFPAMNQVGGYLEEGMAFSAEHGNVLEGFLSHPFKPGYGRSRVETLWNISMGYKVIRTAKNLGKD